MAHYPRACHPLNGKRQAADCLCSVCNLFTWEGTVPRQHLVSSMFLGSHPDSRPIWLRGDQGYRVGGLEEEPLVLGLIFPPPASLGCGSPLGMSVFRLPRAWLRKTTEPSLRAPQDPPEHLCGLVLGYGNTEPTGARSDLLLSISGWAYAVGP